MSDRLSINSYLSYFFGIEEQPAVSPSTNDSPLPVKPSIQNKPQVIPSIPKDISITIKKGDTPEAVLYRALVQAARRAGLPPSEQRAFAEKFSKIGLNWEKGDPNPEDGRAVKPSDYTGQVGGVMVVKLSREIVAELRSLQQSYVARGGRLRSNQEIPSNPNEQAAVRNGISQPTLNADPVDGVTGFPLTAPKTKFQVLLNNDGRAITDARILAQYVEDRHRGGNLWGQNYIQIAEFSIADGVRPKNITLQRIGNRTAVNFELSPQDQAKIENNYRIVQDAVNRAEAAYLEFANNNEVSSFIRGVFNGAVGSIKGTIDLVLDLPGTLKALWQVVSNPVETYHALKNELSQTWEEFKNAPPGKKAEMLGELVGQAVVEILIGKGIGKAGGILAKTKTGAKLLEEANQLKKAGLLKAAETFSDDAARVARESAQNRLRQLSSQLNSGLPIDPALLRDLSIIAGNKIKNGAVKFADFAKQMIDEFGEQIKPHLERLYRDAMEKLGKIVDDGEIRALKLDELTPDEAIPPISRAKRNARLAGKNHPVTNVPFDRQGYPIFNSLQDVKLPANLRGHTISDTKQFEYATGQLRAQIEANPAMKNLFTAKQLEDIQAGEAYIDGLTWHHHQDGIRLQLVDRETHRLTGHDGGRRNTGGRP